MQRKLQQIKRGFVELHWQMHRFRLKAHLGTDV